MNEKKPTRGDWLTHGNFFEKSLAIFGHALAGYMVLVVGLGLIGLVLKSLASLIIS